MNGYRYYAFVDLLGYRELIEADLKQGTTVLKEKLINSFACLNDVNEADVKIEAISDSIFVSLDNGGLGFGYFAEVLCKLQRSFMTNGLLLRGGVAFAPHFANGKVTYSPALVEAYRLESTRAFFPRILIHEAVIAKLRNEALLAALVANRVIVSHAGSYQIHLLADSGVWDQCFSRLKELARESDELLRNDPHVYAKHWYLQEYLAAYKPAGRRFRRYLPAFE